MNESSPFYTADKKTFTDFANIGSHVERSDTTLKHKSTIQKIIIIIPAIFYLKQKHLLV